MASDVFMTKMEVKNPADNRLAKIKRLCEAVQLADTVRPLGEAKGGCDELVCVKMHFGETGNDTYLRPEYARVVVDACKAAGAKPFLADTCTLYKGTRHNGVDYLETAYRHGFLPYVVDCPVVMADGVTSQYWREVEINKKQFKSVKIAGGFLDANAMVVISHFKGHAFGGFGGAIKNLAMGCAPQAGKIDQHGRNVVIYPSCIGCGQCINLCPKGALSLEKKTEGKGRMCVIDRQKCIGCYECVTVCKQSAIGCGLPDEYSEFAERMAEYAYGSVMDLAAKDRVCYINFVMNVTQQCDCAGWSDPCIVPDLGILASKDPVALDQACYDLVKNAPSLINLGDHEKHSHGFDKFKALHPKTEGYHQIEHAEAIGMGTREYTLKYV